MSDVFDNNTGEIRQSVHTPDYLAKENWAINPAGARNAAIGTLPKKYRKLDAGKHELREATTAEKAAIDAAIVADTKEPAAKQK